MKAGYSHISFILDRSGSMASRKDATISGFNEFVNSQKATPGEATFSLYQFDNQYEKDYEFKPMQEVPELNDGNYHPRGQTRLYDAIGKTIVSMGEQLEKMAEDDRPERVFLVIQTDGEENDSREYKFDRVTEMINHQKDVYKWNIVFIGSELQAVKDMHARGVVLGNTLQYDNDDQGVRAAYSILSLQMKGHRMAPSATYCHTSFFDEKAAAADKDEVK